MPEPVDFAPYDWTIRHGDSDRTPPVGLLDRDGDPLTDLSGWTLRAQIRDKEVGLLHEFEPGVGIVIGTGSATIDGKAPVPITTVHLWLRRSDSLALPTTKLRGGAYDLELSRGEFARTVTGGKFAVIADVTRA